MLEACSLGLFERFAVGLLIDTTISGESISSSSVSQSKSSNIEERVALTSINPVSGFLTTADTKAC